MNSYFIEGAFNYELHSFEETLIKINFYSEKKFVHNSGCKYVDQLSLVSTTCMPCSVNKYFSFEIKIYTIYIPKEKSLITEITYESRNNDFQIRWSYNKNISIYFQSEYILHYFQIFNSEYYRSSITIQKNNYIYIYQFSKSYVKYIYGM